MGMGIFEGFGDSIGAWGEMIAGNIAADQREGMRKKQLQQIEEMDQFVDGANVVPEEALSQQGQSAMSGVGDNQDARAIQIDALRRLSKAGQEGYGDQDRAAIANMQADIGAQERGSRMALQQKLGPNSGESMAAQMSNQQVAAQRANLGGLNQAANSRAQALKAVSLANQSAGDMRNQDFGQNAARAQAHDSIARFNAQNAQGVNSRKADRTYDVAGRNMDANLGLQERKAAHYDDLGSDIEKRWHRMGSKHRDASRSGGAGGDRVMAAYAAKG